MIVDQLLDRLLRQIRVDRGSTEAKQRCKMMYLTRLCGLQNDVHAGSLFRTDQMLLQSRNGKQRRDRHTVLIHTTVRKDDDVGSITVSSVHLYEKTVDRLLQAGVLIIGNRNDLYLKALRLHILDLQKVGVSQDRIVHLQHITVFRHFLQQVSVFAKIDRRGRHDLLTDRIDRRVCHLCKKLLKVVEQRMMRLGQHWKRRVHSHRSDRLRAVLCHRQDARF